MPHKLCKVSARSALRLNDHFSKKILLGCVILAPLYGGGRVASNAGQLGALKEFLLKYCWSDQPKTFRIRLPYAIFGELVQMTVTFGMILTMTYQP